MAEFRHGVYTSEVETALQTAPAVDSALPYVVGASKNSFAPRIISSWRQFVEVSGITEGTDDVAGDDGWHAYSLVSFAYLWYKICGRGDCVMRGIASVDGSLAQGEIISAIGEIDTIYERTRRLPSLIVVPYFGGNSAIWAAMQSKAEKYGGRFRAVAIGDIQCTAHAVSGSTPDIISDPADIVDAKTVASESLALCWPYIGIGNLRFDLSSVAVAVMNRVDGQNGDLPYVSPSNKNCYATGVYTLPVVSAERASCVTDADLYVIDSLGAFVTVGADVDGATASLGEIECSAEDGKWKSSVAVDGKASLTFSASASDSVTFTAKTAGTAGNSLALLITRDAQAWDVTLYDGDTVLAAKSNVTSAQYFGTTFDAYVTVTYTGGGTLVGMAKTNFTGGGGETLSVSYPEEAPLFQSLPEINSALGAIGIIGALNTVDGWVLWGNNTTAFPGSTDVKDYILAIRRMFNYTQNLFQLYAQPRIDDPLNRRQLEGVVNSFNQILASLQGFGALNAASVAIDDERNTTEQLIRGVVYFRIKIAPPPPMAEVNGVFEFDVQGFEASLA